VFVCGDLAEKPETWQSVVGLAGYSVSPLPSPVESPEGFNPNEFMINIGLALKELQPVKEEANFSLVNFNALPEVYVPPGFSMTRVLVPVGFGIGIGLIILLAILSQNNRADIERLRSDVPVAETTVNQRQLEIAALRAQIGSTGAIADELNNRIVTMERGNAIIDQDLHEIVTLAEDNNVGLGSVNHASRSVTVNGAASSEGKIFRYARDLRAGGRFSEVWISSISGGDGGFSFEFALTK
jgi:hypothetical protein